MEFITILVVTLFVLIISIIDYRWKPKYGNLLPYRLPIIGHILLFCGKSKDIHKTLEYWADRTGYDSFTLQIFNLEVVVVNSYEGIYEMLVTKGKQLGGRFKLFRLEYTFGEKDVNGSSYSQQWKKKRNLLHLYMKQYGDGIQRFENISVAICGNLIELIANKAKNNDAICVKDDINQAFTNVVSSIIIGRKFDQKDPLFKKWLKLSDIASKDIISLNSGCELDLFPWLRHFGNSTFKGLQEFTNISKELSAGIFDETLNSAYSKENYGLAHMLFNEMNKPEVDYLDADTIRLLIMDLMLGGILTSSRLFYAFLQIMAAYPIIQEKIFSEISKVVDKNTTTVVTLKHRENMPYTQACLLELQRYVSILPVAFPHVAMVDTNILGNKIKKGAIVVPNLWHLHHSSTYWENPWLFSPERFLDEGQVVATDHINRRRVMAFGAGTRVCLGQTLAKTRLFLFCTGVLQKFKVESINDLEAWKLQDPRNYDFELLITPKSQPLKFLSR